MSLRSPRPRPLEQLELGRPFWLRPLGLVSGTARHRAIADGTGLALAGGSAFTFIEALQRGDDGEIAAALAPLAGLRQWASCGDAAAAAVEQRLDRLSHPRPPWAGLALDRPLIMGIVNVTPDSFFDGGAFFAPERAIAHARAMIAAGAEIIDIGGESTRPGAAPVTPEEELQRVLPVIRGLAAAGARLSIDTRHASVMQAALAAGAQIINDVSALAGDPGSLAIAARHRAAVVLMHMQGEPRSMQDNPHYALPSLDILEALAARIEACEAAGIPRSRLVVDPGIGFGKAPQHNLEILGRLSLFHALGCGVMIGLSRKSLVGRMTGAVVEERLPGSLAGALHALAQGAQLLRVHDVAETRQAVAFWQAMAEGA